MAKRLAIKVTAQFECNLEQIERFLTETQAPHAFDDLLDELLKTVIPNLERFPRIGRSFMARPRHSAETTNASANLAAKLSALTPDSEALREYVLDDHLLLYAQIGSEIYLLAIRHQRQLSFDFDELWGAN